MTLTLGLTVGTAAPARADHFALDPVATYLHTSANDAANTPLIIDLGTLSFPVHAGDLLRIDEVGDFSAGVIFPDTGTHTGAVFSSTTTLLAASNEDRVPDAIAPTFVSPSSAFPTITEPTFFGAEPTDIPQDFQVARLVDNQTGVTVQVPAGAKFLFISAYDSFYTDNTDSDHDYGVNINSVPEPATLSLFGIGTVGLIGYAWRRRQRNLNKS